MKIAFLLPAPGISGGLFVCYRHAHFLADRGHNVTMAFVAPSKGSGVGAYPHFSLPVRSLADLAATGERFDAVISGWWECYFEMFRIAADRYLHFVQGDDRDSLRSLHGGSFADEPFVEMAFSNPRVGYLTVARWLKERLEGDADIAVAYAPNGIDLNHFHQGATPLEPRGKRPRILIEGAGSLAFKRIDLAFRVARQITDADVWYVASDGFTKSEWHAQRRFAKVPFGDMPAIYRSCDVLLKLSVVEGFFGPPLEMMACGGTALVSRVNGYEEYVVDGHNALTVPLDDEAAAVATLRQLIGDASLRHRISANGIETARNFGWEQQCPKFEAGFMELVDRIPVWRRGESAALVGLTELRTRVARSGASSRRSLFRRPSGLLSLVPSLMRSMRRRFAASRPVFSGNETVAQAAIPLTPLRTISGPLGPIAFVGQPEYFRAAYFDGVKSGEHFEFPMTSADPAERLRGLADFVRANGIRSCIVFRPEWLSSVPGLVERLQSDDVRVIGYSTEPIPTAAAAKWHPDQTSRLDSLRRALPLPLDLLVHYDMDSEAFLRRLGFSRLMCHPLPVSNSLFYPENVPFEFDACFLGRSTPHRERLLGLLKCRSSIVHVAHGLVDEQARALMNRSRVVLNIHCEPYPNFETRVVQALRCGRPVVSEPLSGTYLTPGVDYQAASTPEDFLAAVQRIIASGPSDSVASRRADLKHFSLDTLLARIAAELGCEVSTPCRAVA
ncbi:MAG: glycosyltransferase [Chthoniobacterales bacterium]